MLWSGSGDFRTESQGKRQLQPTAPWRLRKAFAQTGTRGPLAGDAGVRTRKAGKNRRQSNPGFTAAHVRAPVPRPAIFDWWKRNHIFQSWPPRFAIGAAVETPRKNGGAGTYH